MVTKRVQEKEVIGNGDTVDWIMILFYAHKQSTVYSLLVVTHSVLSLFTSIQIDW